jgi:toxin ParE1/3/4
VVKWSKPAKLNLRQIHEYIKKDSKFYAKKVYQEIVDKSEILNHGGG